METKPAPWGSLHLWTKSKIPKCRIDLVDTILVRGPSPVWLFTDKHGEIRKKNASHCTGKVLRKRLLSIAKEVGCDKCFVLRYSASNIVKLGGIDALDNLLKNDQKWPQETGLCAIQSFVPSALGPSGCLHLRTRGQLVDSRGRFMTNHWSLSLVPPEKSQEPGLVTGDVGPNALTPLTSVHLRDRLDRRTQGVLRYLEEVASLEKRVPVRVMSLEVDFILDEYDTLWVSWVGDAVITSGQAAMDVRLLGGPFTDPKLSGRDVQFPLFVRRHMDAKHRASELAASQTFLEGPKEQPRRGPIPTSTPQVPGKETGLAHQLAAASALVTARGEKGRREARGDDDLDKPSPPLVQSPAFRDTESWGVHVASRRSARACPGSLAHSLGDFAAFSITAPPALAQAGGGSIDESGRSVWAKAETESAPSGPPVALPCVTLESILRAKADLGQRYGTCVDSDRTAGPGPEAATQPASRLARVGWDRATAPTEAWERRTELWAGHVKEAWHGHAKGALDLYKSIPVDPREVAVYQLLGRARGLEHRSSNRASRAPPAAPPGRTLTRTYEVTRAAETEEIRESPKKPDQKAADGKSNFQKPRRRFKKDRPQEPPLKGAVVTVKGETVSSFLKFYANAS
mmetsp:Transcript_64791/g.146154  ORF Transcript_64791/g.146154 Transcript_64791/m.146154 type:complete len:629 (-) Transcript_64791:55-1941(-)